MGRIQSSIGLVTGTDIAGTVDQLIAISAQPRDRLQARTQALQTEQQAIAELTASVIAVQLSGSRLSSSATFRSNTADSSNSDALSALAGNAATPATYTVRTLQTAATHTVESRARFDSDTEALGFTGSISLAPNGFLDQSIALSELNNGRGVEAGRIRITDRSGVSDEIDLSNAQTIDDVLTAINDAAVDVIATTVDGRLQLTDHTGQTSSNLIVDQLGNAETAADLGIFGIDVAANSATGFDLTFRVDVDTDLSQLRQGQGVRLANGNDLSITLADGTNFDVDFGDFGGAQQPTIGNVLDQLNALDPTKLSATFTQEGIQVTDLSTGSETFSIANAAGSNTASDLRLAGSAGSANTITAEFAPQVLRGTALSQLAGGSGLSDLTTLNITTSNGDTAAIDLSSAGNTAEIIDAINGSGLNLIARLNDSGNGLRLRDVSGGSGNFIVDSADATASQLGIVANTENDIVIGGSLAPQTVNNSTLLSELNRGAGIDDGSFTITDSNGNVSAINLTTDAIESVGDLIDRINGLNLDVTASLSPNGDGVAIVDTGGGSGTLTIEDSGTGTAAADLGIAGVASQQTIDGSTESALVGSQSDRIAIEATDSLVAIVDKLNTSERYGTAAVQFNDDGTFSLRVRSNQGGATGRFGLSVSGFDLNLDTTSVAQDAVIAVSIDGGTERLLTSSDGVFDVDAAGANATTITAATQLTDFAPSASNGSFILTDSNGQRSAINITVSGIQTVGELIDQINSLGIGVQAQLNENSNGISIIDTAGGDETLRIEDVGNGIAAASIGFAGEGTTQTINGTTVSALTGLGQDGNGDDATGLSLTLKELSAEAITVTVTEDNSAITSAANSFVDQYNNLVERLESLTFFNADTNEVGLLFGSSEAQRIQTGYTRLLSGVINGAGSIRSVGQVGIRFNDQGRLSLDSSRLTDAIENNRGDVEAFFTTSETGLASRLNTLADRIAGADSSLLTNRRLTLANQVERNNSTIETLNERLDRERERLQEQFFRTEEAISRLRSNQSAIDSISRITIPSS